MVVRLVTVTVRLLWFSPLFFFFSLLSENEELRLIVLYLRFGRGTANIIGGPCVAL